MGLFFNNNGLLCLSVICYGVIVHVVDVTHAYKHGELIVDERIRTSGDLLSSIFNDCGDLYCVKNKVLSYLDNLLGVTEETARNLKDTHIDKVIYSRVERVLRTQDFSVPLPFGFVMNYNPQEGVEIDAPLQVDDDQSTIEARGLLKKKLLIPALVLLKLKLKALMPIFVALIGIKALKALILSKLAITLVVGFLIYQLCMKKGMAMPMMMMPSTELPIYGPPSSPAPPPSMYGPPSNMYGAPITGAPPLDSYGAPITGSGSQSAANSYDPAWEPSGPNQFKRVWSGSGSVDDTPTNAHNIVYSSYYSTISSSTNSPK